MSWMQTHSGRAFDLIDPKPEDVHLSDISHSLSMICRYNGHVSGFYSVAEHCCHIYDWLGMQGLHQRIMLAGLLHDAPEAYVGDVIWPVQQALPEFRDAFHALQARVWAVMRVALDIPETVDLRHALVREADVRILLDERAALLTTPPPIPWAVEHLQPLGVEIQAWGPREARVQWLSRYLHILPIVRRLP